jgi:hypothetical protein
MRILVLLALATPAAAQVSIGPGGIRSGDTVIDERGVHTNGVDVGGGGVRTGGGRGTIVSTNGGRRSLSCGGGALTVNGNANRLNVRDCARVTVNGNRNIVDVSFGRTGRLGVFGNRNQVRWSAPPRAQVSISSPGTGNTVRRR